MDRSVPKHVQRARRAAPGHHDPACTGASSAAEIRDGLVLAFLARKRLLVLLGDAGSGRPALFRQLVEHVEADGAMALPVTASVGVQVEDLITAAGTGALPDLVAEGEGGEPEFDALIGALEERLELAGAGLLAVDNATVLAPPVLADLVELTRAETPAGRFIQVLLCGTPELEGTLARAGLTDVLRDTGVIYRLGPDASAAAEPFAAEPFADGPAPDPFTIPMPGRPAPGQPAILAAPPPAPEPMPDPARRTGRNESTQPANDWAASFDWSDRGSDGMPVGIPGGGMGHAGGPVAGDPMLAGAAKAPRRTALYAGAALTTLVLLGAAGAAIATAVPGATPDKALAMIGEGWSRTRDAVERTVQGLVGDTHRDAPEGEALALGRKTAADTPPAAPHPAAAAQPATVQAGAPTAAPTVTATATPPAAPLQTAALPPATAPTATTPAPADPAPTASVKSPVASGSASGTAEAAPGSASLPPLEEPSATPAIPAVPQTATPAADTAQRVRALADQARRQIAGKRLTTPPGDNAYETVQRLRQIAPSAPEAGELLATMTDTYRRWGMLAERDGDWSEAKRFYERAQMVSPASPDLAERIRAATEQRAYTGPAGPAPAGGTPSTVAPAAPADAAPGLQNRESVLALLRDPTELARTLQGGTSPDTRLDSGKTLLMIAAEQGLTDAVRVLLDRHARTDLRTADGATAVMYAAWGGHDGVVRALADGGADLDATNSDGKTALMAAAARGHEDVARTLIQRGVAVDRATAYGWSALMYAANNGHEGVAKLLVDRGANPYRMDTNGNSALTLGALQGHVQVVEALKPR